MTTAAVVEVDRTQVMAYRIAAQQLDRSIRRPADLDVLDLGVQDTPYGSAALAVAARAIEPLREGDLALVWAARGAPHLHRWADLRTLPAALWPLSDADAGSRIASSQVKAARGLGLRAFVSAARAFREVVTTAMSKGEVSAGVTALVPPEATFDCRPCGSRHVSGALFQQAGLAGGVRLEMGGATTTTIVPLDDPADLPAEATGTRDLVLAYLRLHGPATPGDAAKFLNIKSSEIKQVWPDDLVEVAVEGRRTWLPADRVDALRSARTPRLVRLLPPSDPLLQARDRDLLVPGKERQKEIWRILGSPGVLLLDDEIVGTWRARKRGKTTADITVTPFQELADDVRDQAEAEAQRVAVVRGEERAVVTFAD